VINEAFARRYFPGEDPLGRRLNFDDPTAPVWWDIVGVAGDVRHFGVRGDARPSLYAPLAQFPARTLFYVVRSPREPGALTSDVRNALATVDAGLAAGQIARLDELVARSLAPERFLATLVSLFAGIALALAVVGFYGIVSYTVSTRLKELGVRLALGASGREVALLVLRKSALIAAAGLALGLLGSAALTRLLGTLLFDVEAGDPATFLVATALLAGAALLASLLPARRAAGVHPAVVLREE
jgi:putative ABC transport system permease protein